MHNHIQFWIDLSLNKLKYNEKIHH